MLVGLLSGWRGAGVLRAKQPTLREPAISQSAHVVRSALRCTCRLSRNGGLRNRECLAPKAAPPRTTCSLRLPPGRGCFRRRRWSMGPTACPFIHRSLCRGGGRRCCPRASAVGHAWALLQPCRPLAAARGQPADSRPSYGGLVGVPTLHGHVRVNRGGRRRFACRLGLCLER